MQSRMLSISQVNNKNNNFDVFLFLKISKKYVYSLIETIDEANKKKAVDFIKPVVGELDMSKPGAKLLKQKLTE